MNYPYAHYRINSETLWRRLASVVPQTYLSKIEDAEMNFYFTINSSFITAILGFECLVMSLYDVSILSVTAVIVFFSITYVLYEYSCIYARDEWGEYVRSVFDLYRFDLLKQMGVFLPPQPITLQQERGIWILVQSITYYSRNPGDELRFLPRSWELRRMARSRETIQSDGSTQA
jgi:hypothetical protein